MKNTKFTSMWKKTTHLLSRNILSTAAVIALMGAATFAAAPAGGYLPWATLDPDCAPSDTDCIVVNVWIETDPLRKFVDWSTITDAVFTGGKVGIWTNIPTVELDILWPSSWNAIQYLRNADPSMRAINFVWDESIWSWNYGYLSHHWGSYTVKPNTTVLGWWDTGWLIMNSTQWPLVFSTQSLIERMRIDNATGNVWIWTTWPSEKLSVNNGKIRVMDDSTGGTYDSKYYVSPALIWPNPWISTFSSNMEGVANGHMIFDLRNNDVADTVAFRYSSTDDTVIDTVWMVMRGDGNVWIWTTSPSSKLVIWSEDTTRTQQQIFNYSWWDAKLLLSTNATGWDPYITFNMAWITNWHMWWDRTDNGKFKLWMSWLNPDDVSVGNRLTIDRTGNVWIWTTGPNDWKLQIANVTTWDSGVVILKDWWYNSEWNNGIRIFDTTAWNQALQMWVDATENVWYIQAMDPATSWATVPLVLQWAWGNVWIWTTTPSSTLEVRGWITYRSEDAKLTVWSRQESIASYSSSSSSTTEYIHIRLPHNTDTQNGWYRVEVEWYDYGGWKWIDLRYVWYSYVTSNSLLATDEYDLTWNYTPISYIGSDNHIYLRFKPTNLYFLSFVVNYQAVHPWAFTVNPWDITVIADDALQL